MTADNEEARVFWWASVGMMVLMLAGCSRNVMINGPGSVVGSEQHTVFITTNISYVNRHGVFLAAQTNGYSRLSSDDFRFHRQMYMTTQEFIYSCVAFENGSWYGYGICGAGYRVNLYVDKLSFTNQTVTETHIKKTVLYSTHLWEGYSLSGDPELYTERTRLTPTTVEFWMSGETSGELFWPHFCRIDALLWTDMYDFPAMAHVVVDRQSHEVVSCKSVQYFRRLRSKERSYETQALLSDTPQGTNYLIVYNEGLKRLEIVGMQDNGTVFAEVPLVDCDENVTLLYAQRMSPRTYWLCATTNLFVTNQFALCGMSFINVNWYLPPDFCNNDAYFANSNVVIAGSVSRSNMVVALRYEAGTVNKTEYSGGPRGKWEYLSCIQRPNGDVDVVLRSEQPVWPTVCTVKSDFRSIVGSEEKK